MSKICVPHTSEGLFHNSFAALTYRAVSGEVFVCRDLLDILLDAADNDMRPEPTGLRFPWPDPMPICEFHAYRCYPADRHPAFVIYTDAAGPQPLCKTSLDNRLDNADDDDELEPLALRFLPLPEEFPECQCHAVRHPPCGGGS